jgi:hypothetical protein
MQIAAQHSETVGKGAGVSVEKWFLLDGITLHSSDVAPRNVKRASVVKANPANSGLSFRNWAAVSAGITSHTIAIEFLPKRRVAFADALIRSKCVVQSGHIYILRRHEWVCLVFARPVEQRWPMCGKSGSETRFWVAVLIYKNSLSG